MENILEISKYIHIIAGFAAFVGAPIALATAKGGYYHRLFGKVFFWSMTTVSATAFFNAAFKGIAFLFFLSVFTFYLAASGYRALYRKNIKGPSDVSLTDWLLTSANALFCLGLLGYSGWMFYLAGVQPFGIIALAFGAIGLRGSMLDYRKFRDGQTERKGWLRDHITGMFAAYIAAWSAFSAVNMNFLPTVVQWLWPTLLGVPVMIWLTGKYLKK